MSKFTPAELFSQLKLASRFHNDVAQLKFELKDLDKKLVKELTAALEAVHSEYKVGFGPIGKFVTAWANESVARIHQVLAEKAAKAVPVAKPVVKEEPVVEPVVEEVDPVEQPIVEIPTPVESTDETVTQ